MQTFQDTATGAVWAYNADVVATVTAGVYSFAAPDGTPLAAPTTLQPFTPPPSVIPAVDMRPAAQAALDRSDITIIRCYEHAVAVPADWVAYRNALRAIVAGGPTSAAPPPAPAFPAGT